MASHKIILDLRGADRESWNNGTVSLTLRKFGLGGLREWERVVISTTTDEFPVDIEEDLTFNRGEDYYLDVKAPNHHRNYWILNRHHFSEDGAEIQRATLKMILIPKRIPSSTNLRGGFNKLEALNSPFVQQPDGISRKEYEALTVPAQMALLNFEAKLRATEIACEPLINSVTGLVRTGLAEVPDVDPDRIYVEMKERVKTALRDRKKRRAAQFTCAKLGHKGHPHSWKQQAFPRGNLQLSFSEYPIDIFDGESLYSVDVDIDLERGNRHAPEVLFGGTTNPAIVYSLLYTQGICPPYTLAL